MVVTLANQALRIICIIAALGMVSMAQANPYVAAALPWSNGKVQLFLSDGTYLRYDTQTERIDQVIQSQSMTPVGRGLAVLPS